MEISDVKNAFFFPTKWTQEQKKNGRVLRDIFPEIFWKANHNKSYHIA